MSLTYDNAGRKLTMADPDMGNWSYVYNALGGMTRQEDAKDQVTCLYYDDLNRPRGTLSYLLGDHIGSSSVTTDANGGFTASLLCRSWLSRLVFWRVF